MRKTIQLTLHILLIIFVSMGFAGCGQSANKASVKSESNEASTLFQLEPPKEGDEIAIVETDLGTIKFKLFTDLSPQCVEIFKNYAIADYYSDVAFDRIEPGFMSQIDYKATFPDEVDEAEKMFYPLEDALDLKHIKGAVSLIYQNGEYASPSLAFVMSGEVSQEELDLMAYLGEESYSKDMITEYHEDGGMPSFDGRFTVIGQVYEGYDVLEAISQLPVEEASDNKSHHLPKEPLAIKRITIETYK